MTTGRINQITIIYRAHESDSVSNAFGKRLNRS